MSIHIGVIQKRRYFASSYPGRQSLTIYQFNGLSLLLHDMEVALGHFNIFMPEEFLHFVQLEFPGFQQTSGEGMPEGMA